MGGACGTYGRREMYAGFSWGNVKGTDLGVDGRIIIKHVLMKECGKMGDRIIWFRIVTSSE